MDVHFKFSLEDSVIIKAISARAVVDMVMFSAAGTEYRVTYWLDGCRRQEWLREYELTEL